MRVFFFIGTFGSRRLRGAIHGLRVVLRIVTLRLKSHVPHLFASRPFPYIYTIGTSHSERRCVFRCRTSCWCNTSPRSTRLRFDELLPHARRMKAQMLLRLLLRQKT